MQDQLLRAITEPGIKQATIAAIYASVLRHEGETADWAAINVAIREKWPTGLLRVKKMAWKILEGDAPWT